MSHVVIFAVTLAFCYFKIFLFSYVIINRSVIISVFFLLKKLISVCLFSQTSIILYIMSNTLTPKQEAFCQAYVGVTRGNATASAKLAGYSGNDNTVSTTGCETLKIPKVRARIEELRREISEEWTIERVIASWEAIATDSEAQDKDRLRAVELIAKSKGYFTEKRVNLNVEADVEKISPRMKRAILHRFLGDPEVLDLVDELIDIAENVVLVDEGVDE